ncbi:response regulator [Candidatus Poribacteria bacterium]|nr:response regulator [Candidatus Poribacteria bacterium]
MEFKKDWNYRVLVVDDQREIHQDFEEMLTPGATGASTDDLADAFASEVDESFLPKFELLHARSGAEAYDTIEAAIEADNPIAVAYIDIRMPPGMDGIETTRRIRAIDENLEIVLMTAYTDKSLGEIVREMDLLHKLLYIRKPFAREEIQQITLALAEKWNVEGELGDKRRQLEISNQRLKSVLDSTGDAIAMFDIAGHLLFANQGYEEMFELTTDVLKQMSPEKLCEHTKQYFQEPERFEEAETLLLTHPEKVLEEVVEVRRSETIGTELERKMLYRFTAPVHDIEQEVIGRIIVFRDISKEIEISQMKVEVSRLRTELEMKYAFDKIVGKSQEMKAVYALMQQAIESNITVLIQGESGTGKELVARAIHFNSPRKAGPFVDVNCAAIPESLIESELFGHERGAFTGATAQRIGKFESASGGTIFLDEIADMQPLVQAKLLRVLQEREIQRVGGTGNIPINVRVIAATNRDLEAAVKAGAFREDLFYRIAGFPIPIPPLKERREDIPLLGHHFLQEYAKAADKPISGFSSGALQVLVSYDWPGNVRELENTIERAMLLETSDVLQAGNPALSDLHSTGKEHTSDSDDASMPSLAATSTEILSLEEIEKQALVHALEVTDHNITKAAQALGINRVTIHRKLRKYNLLDKG